jgi:hypothetical protein
VAERLRKKCGDCGTRGNWPKTLIIDTCPECTSLRLKHDVIRKQYYDQCIKTGSAKGCSGADKCESCTKYFASASHTFFLTH